MRIKLTGKNSKNKSVSIYIPVLPEKIAYKSEGRFQEYEIINKGPAKVPNGKEPTLVGWESFFPGPILKNERYVYKYKSPKTYHNQIEYWRRNGKKVKVLITGTPINFYAYISTYEETYEGANGSINYAIEFTQAIDIAVERVKKKKGKTSGLKRASKRNSKSYVVKKGDCLWNIAKKFYKDATKWKKIYTANKSTIESAAKKHGRKSSSHGHWIYPGTKLRIP